MRLWRKVIITHSIESNPTLFLMDTVLVLIKGNNTNKNEKRNEFNVTMHIWLQRCERELREGRLGFVRWGIDPRYQPHL